MKVAVFGAGMMAKAACYDLCRNKAVSHVRIITRTDKEGRALKKWLRSKKVDTHSCDVTDVACVAGSLKNFDIALSCVPYVFNYVLAKAAIASGTHFIDLGGNNAVVKKELSLHKQAKKKGVLVVPDCGLAPGLVSVFTKQFVDEFDLLSEVHLRVGGLPLKPTGPLKYALVFSVKGLINEYIEPVAMIRNKKKVVVDPLSELESLDFPKPFGKLEAFTTSGGTSTLPDTYRGKIKTLDYKTIRYPGHCAQIQVLHWLGLTSSKPLGIQCRTMTYRDVLEHALLDKLPRGVPDVILLRCWGVGKKKGRKRTITYQIIDKYDKRSGLTAMMRMTAFSATVLVDLIGRGVIKDTGVMTQEHFVPAQKILLGLKKRGIKIKRSVR